MQLIVGDAGRFGQIVPAQIVTELEVKDGKIVGFETGTGIVHEGDELGGLQRRGGRSAGMFEGLTDAHGVTGAGLGAAAGEGVTLVASHGKQPRPNSFGLTELGQTRRRPDEHLVGDVGRIVRRSGQAGAEVEQLRSEPVIQFPKRVSVPLGRKRRHFGIGCESEGPRHGEQAYETHCSSAARAMA